NSLTGGARGKDTGSTGSIASRLALAQALLRLDPKEALSHFQYLRGKTGAGARAFRLAAFEEDYKSAPGRPCRRGPGPRGWPRPLRPGLSAVGRRGSHRPRGRWPPPESGADSARPPRRTPR